MQILELERNKRPMLGDPKWEADLLCDILKYLPMQDLYVVRRVNTKFCNATHLNEAIARKMWFLPSSKEEDIVPTLRAQGIERVEDLDSLSFTVDLERAESQCGQRKEVKVNPFWLQIRGSATMMGRTAGPCWYRRARRPDGSDKQESWRHMFLTDPPCKMVEFWVYQTKASRNGVQLPRGQGATEVASLGTRLYCSTGIPLGAIAKYHDVHPYFQPGWATPKFVPYAPYDAQNRLPKVNFLGDSKPAFDLIQASAKFIWRQVPFRDLYSQDDPLTVAGAMGEYPGWLKASTDKTPLARLEKLVLHGRWSYTLRESDAAKETSDARVDMYMVWWDRDMEDPTVK